jgi:hypothetical protein
MSMFKSKTENVKDLKEPLLGISPKDTPTSLVSDHDAECGKHQ